MNTVRKILVPIDFSDDSADGLNYAVSLAQKTQAELFALHVTQKEDTDWFLDFLSMMEGHPMVGLRPGIPVDRLLREKALDLYRFIEKVIRNPGQVKIRRKVVLGNQAEKIVKVVEEERIDLVVLPVPKTPFFPYLTARGRLLRRISRLSCPVLLKPSPDEPWPTSGILGPSIFAR